MVKKFVDNTTMTTKRKSTAFTTPARKMLRGAEAQGITARPTRVIRLNNRAVPLNPLVKDKPRAGNFGTKRLAGF